MRATAASDAPDRLRLAGRGRRRVERWWAGSYGAAGRVLSLLAAPLEGAYRTAVAVHHGLHDAGLRAVRRAEVPVVSVGNLTVGGTGKTPVTEWVVRELRRRGHRPGVLHGGYGADEPALHRAWHPDLPVLEHRDRVEAARRAIDAGATAVVLDDGFQHRRMARDLDIVLVAAEQWSGKRRLLPRGPWREPPRALRRAHVVAVTHKSAGADRARSVAAAVGEWAERAVRVRIALRPAGWRRPGRPTSGAGPRGGVVAVAGIAGPDLFVEDARAAGARVTGIVTAPDHHEYTAGDLEKLRDFAAERAIVTTAKDAVKLTELAAQHEVWILEQDVVVEEGLDGLAECLDRLKG